MEEIQDFGGTGFAMPADLLPEPMLRVDRSGVIKAANTAFGLLVERDVDEMVDASVGDFFIEGFGEIDGLLRDWLEGSSSSAHILTLRAVGRLTICQCLGIAMRDGSIVLRVVPEVSSTDAEHSDDKAAELTRRKDAHDRLAKMLLHDELTGLPNRVLLRDRLSAVLRQRTLREHPCSVLFIDLDGFKEINDTHGHSVGDDALREVAIRLRATVRPGDTVARIGGDEFVVLLPDVDTATGVLITERILLSLRVPFLLDTASLKLAASVGVVAVQEPAQSDQVIQLADKAMYQVKAAGGDGWLSAQSAVA